MVPPGDDDEEEIELDPRYPEFEDGDDDESLRPPPAPVALKAPRTDKAILRAARKLFATHGYQGATIRNITLGAEVNVSAVSYHFNNKRDLYQQILRSILGPLAVQVEQVAKLQQFPPLDRIERIVREFFYYIRANPDLPAFMVREMAQGKTPAKPVIQTMRRALPALAGVIAEGQREGTIRPGDALLMALSTVAQPVYLFLARSAIRATAHVDTGDDPVLEHIVTTVRAALEKR